MNSGSDTSIGKEGADSRARVFLPGSRLGILGDGQLGRMLAQAAQRLGYRVVGWGPNGTGPLAQVVDQFIEAEYHDAAALQGFANAVDWVTYEFENLPVKAVHLLEQKVPVRPSSRVLETSQDRIREKKFLKSIGAPCAPWWEISAESSLDVAFAESKPPFILKTSQQGYDGKGQVRVHSLAEAQDAFRVFAVPCVLERVVDLKMEVSVIGARGLRGEFRHWGAIENSHANHILDWSVAPARLDPKTTQAALDWTRKICESLEVIGVVCVEFFVDAMGGLWVNEIAPRPHNSGHASIEGAVTSQFEQQARATAGLALGDSAWRGRTAMVNLLGDGWAAGEPNWERMLQFQTIKMHLYGKVPRVGRKMGHLTLVGVDVETALEQALKARTVLFQPASGVSKPVVIGH